MNLINSMMDRCTLIDKVSRTDGLGGFSYEWTDGATFDAAIIKDNTLAARVAEKDGVTEVYTVTVDRGMQLDYHDVFRRESDGAIFRVTSNIYDSQSPAVSTIKKGQVTAERWVLT